MRPVDGITVHVHVDADPDTAFRVFTDDVDSWWQRGPAYRFRPDGGTLRFESGPDGRLVEGDANGEYVVGRVLRWEPGAHLEFEFIGPNFRPGQRTLVAVRFAASRTGTDVTLSHSGWDGLPQDHPVRHGLADDAFHRQWGGMWTRQLRALRACAFSSSHTHPSDDSRNPS